MCVVLAVVAVGCVCVGLFKRFVLVLFGSEVAVVFVDVQCILSVGVRNVIVVVLHKKRRNDSGRQSVFAVRL